MEIIPVNHWTTEGSSMNENTTPTNHTEQKPWWWRLQSGQALVEYWPTIPAAVMIMIAASAIVMPLGNMFEKTADGLSGIECDAPVGGPTVTDLDGGHRIEVTSSVYDPDTDRTTVSFKVSSGDKPSISHWVLGIDEDTADKIVDTNEAFENWGTDPTTGKTGIKFDTGYDGGGGSSEDGSGGGGGKGKGSKKIAYSGGSFGNLVLASTAFKPHFNVYVEEREIVLTFTGRVDFIEEVEVTTKAGSSQVSTGHVTVPAPSGGSSEDCSDSGSYGNV
jgi:hypothetical protein